MEKKTDIGKITVNNNIFARVVLDSLERFEGLVFPASEHAKVLGGIDKYVSERELLPYLAIKESDLELKIKFCVILKFGESISRTMNTLLNDISESFRIMYPQKDIELTIKLVGVKSRLISKRDLEFKKKVNVPLKNNIILVEKE